MGELTVLLMSDDTLQALSGRPPKFPMAERFYFLKAIRYVNRVVPVWGVLDPSALPEIPGLRPQAWIDRECGLNEARQKFCADHELDYHVLSKEQLMDFPEPSGPPPNPGRPKVVVTGCYDWFHSGHVRFFEEASAHGDLYVIVGHDANIRLLKGEGHPMLSQEERRYMTGSIRYVTRAMISSGEGWLDADPEIQKLKPDLYVVNEDGDKGGKREYCAQKGIQYLVLKRKPAPGLPQRSSTVLRGF